MIYTLEKEYDYHGCQLIVATDSLNLCVDAANAMETFPYCGDYLVFRTWKDDKCFAVSTIPGQRHDYRSDVENPVTFEEVMKNMKLVQNEG